MSAMNSKRQYETILSPRGNFIGGQFRIPTEKNGEILVKSPADFSDFLGAHTFSYADAERAVVSARSGFEIWRKVPLAQRVECLQKYAENLKQLEATLSQMIAREVGKPLWEAKQEVATMINKVDVTIKEGMKPVTDYEIPAILPDTLGACRFRPHGVFVVVGPFNFPGHLANGHIVPALLAGNAIVFKPSEKCPGTGQLMTEAFQKAGFPDGVFNLVQGDGEVGRRLCVHEGVDGILFTGSYEVGLKIKQDTLHHYWKILALEMGGKNTSIVSNDADIDYAVYEVLTSAYITTGQRCSATSRVIVHSSILDQFVNKFHKMAKGFRIGHPLDNPFMGPLVDEKSVEKYLKFTGIAEREGCEIVMRGKQFEAEYQGHYVTPSICLVKDNSLGAVKKSVYQQTEIFGPNVAIYSYEDFDHALEIANATQYGLAASVFTSDRAQYEKSLLELKSGIINWNRSTVGASSRLPFGGLKKSGNHFPTAISASNYCAYPVASLEIAEPKMAATLLPGLIP